MTTLTELYYQDYSEWAYRNSVLLRNGHYAELDIEHLLEELNDMGQSARNELESRLLILLAHLLKWEYQYKTLTERWCEFDGRSWRTTIIEQRKRISIRLKKTPSLQPFLVTAITTVYSDAVELASDESGLPLNVFPSQCPYDINQLLDKHFYPKAQ